MKDVDPNSLEFGELFPGSELPSKYEMPALSDWKGEVEEGLVVYSGACHCVAVTYAVKTKSLDEQKVLECNCSLCSRVRFLFLSFIILRSHHLRCKFANRHRMAISGSTLPRMPYKFAEMSISQTMLSSPKRRCIHSVAYVALRCS
jgi:hypothetical protein